MWKTVRLTCGANRENITVLGAVCADGKACPPLIVFKGQRVQSTWVGKNAIRETRYAATENGWMTTTVFENFFEQFVEYARAHTDRPILVFFDGHTSHTSKKTRKLAKDRNIELIKFPAHCTDLLQPLDVGCFAPLKGYYETKLMEHVHATAAREQGSYRFSIPKNTDKY